MVKFVRFLTLAVIFSHRIRFVAVKKLHSYQSNAVKKITAKDRKLEHKFTAVMQDALLLIFFTAIHRIS